MHTEGETNASCLKSGGISMKKLKTILSESHTVQGAGTLQGALQDVGVVLLLLFGSFKAAKQTLFLQSFRQP